MRPWLAELVPIRLPILNLELEWALQQAWARYKAQALELSTHLVLGRS